MEKSPALLFFSGQKTKLRAQFRFLFVHLPEKPVSMKRSRRSTWLPAALALYLTVSYVWLYVNGSIPLDARSVALVGLSYALVAWPLVGEPPSRTRQTGRQTLTTQRS